MQDLKVTVFKLGWNRQLENVCLAKKENKVTLPEYMGMGIVGVTSSWMIIETQKDGM